MKTAPAEPQLVSQPQRLLLCAFIFSIALQATTVISLLFRIFLFLSGSSVETNITSHIALTQDTPGDLKLVIKDCRNLYGGIKVNLRKG